MDFVRVIVIARVIKSIREGVCEDGCNQNQLYRQKLGDNASPA